MKLMPPWRYSTTSLERCFATSVKPIFSNKGSSTLGWGDANSTNSNPIKPIGFSNRSDIWISMRERVRERGPSLELHVGLLGEPRVALLLAAEVLGRGLGGHRVNDVFLLGHGVLGLGHLECRDHRCMQALDLGGGQLGRADEGEPAADFHFRKPLLGH